MVGVFQSTDFRWVILAINCLLLHLFTSKCAAEIHSYIEITNNEVFTFFTDKDSALEELQSSGYCVAAQNIENERCNKINSLRDGIVKYFNGSDLTRTNAISDCADNRELEEFCIDSGFFNLWIPIDFTLKNSWENKYGVVHKNLGERTLKILSLTISGYVIRVERDTENVFDFFYSKTLGVLYFKWHVFENGNRITFVFWSQEKNGLGHKTSKNLSKSVDIYGLSPPVIDG